MKTVMIVDDEPDVREAVKIVLERNGIKTVTAVNGDDCLKKLKRKKVDLVLLDIMMPGIPVRNWFPRLKASKLSFCLL